MNKNNLYSELSIIIDPLIENKKFKFFSKKVILKRVLELSKDDPYIAQTFVQLILLIEAEKENEILKVLELSPKAKDGETRKKRTENTTQLLLRTALMSFAICWIGLAILKTNTIIPLGWMIGLGILLFVVVQIKHTISVEQKIYQIIIAILPNLVLLLIQQVQLSPQSLVILTIAVSMLAAIVMLIFQTIAQKIDKINF